jgi:hypothetical protein
VAFPPRPNPFHGRAAELATLVAACRSGVHPRLALVGPGGGGKSTLAAALGHRLAREFPGGVEWLRVGAWDHRTLLDMLAIRLGVPLGRLDDRRRRLHALRGHLRKGERRLVVLDNHEDDRALSRFLNALGDVPVFWVITARRCLLAGVSVFPVVAPLATAGGTPFRAVAELTALLRWNVLALDIASALVKTGAVTAPALGAWLRRHGVARVEVVAHEDDVPEIRLLVRWVWPHLGPDAHRLLAVLAHLEGDHADLESLAVLARTGRGTPAALRRLRAWHLVQEPLPGRFTLHATLKYALRRRTRFDRGRAVAHYVTLLERHPERLDLEQTNLFAAMDHAHSQSDLGLGLRLGRLLERLGFA